MIRYKLVFGILFVEDLEIFVNGNKWIYVFVLDFLGKKKFCCVWRIIFYFYCFNNVYYIDYFDFVIWMDYFILFLIYVMYVCKCFY